MKENIITQKGFEELQKELQYLKTTKRSEIAKKIKEAREQGDLSENAEYEAAKEEQGQIEARIEKITDTLNNAVVVESDKNSDKVTFGSIVKIKDLSDNKEYTYTLVGSSEADILNNKISNVSPLGYALFGHIKGDVVRYRTNESVEKYLIMDVE